MKLTDNLFKLKDSFIPMYGVNKAKKVGRRILKDDEVIVFDKKSLITKDYIQKSYTRQEEIRCTDEVANLINCLAINDYDSNQCTKEYIKARNCKQKEQKLRAERRKQANLSTLPDLSNDLNIAQINRLLSDYKIPKNTKN